MTIQEYRAVDCLSYSAIKDFLKKGRKYFHKKYVLREPVEDPDSSASRLGSAVDCLRFTPQDFDSLFLVGDTNNIPTGKGGVFVKELFRLQELGGEFIENAQKAYDMAELKKPTFEVYMQNFEGSDLELSYINMIEAKSKTVLSLTEAGVAEHISKMLIEHKQFSKIFNSEGYNQLPLIYEINGIQFKGLLDRVKIDHENKVIKPYDLKVTYEDEAFEFNWFKNKYYIQQGIYEELIKRWKKENYPTYRLDPFRFIVVSSSGQNQPLLYELTPFEGTLMYGFQTTKGTKYKGFMEVANEINWHIQNDIWDVSKENYEKFNFIKKVV